jgi:hypothetical protein
LWIALEDLFILVSVFALWPSILGWEGWVWEALKYVAAAGLLWIFVRRVRRYKERRAAPGANGGSN